jgi:hypothetical protein
VVNGSRIIIKINVDTVSVHATLRAGLEFLSQNAMPSSKKLYHYRSWSLKEQVVFRETWSLSHMKAKTDRKSENLTGQSLGTSVSYMDTFQGLSSTH